jgi:hypothetical protein
VTEGNSGTKSMAFKLTLTFAHVERVGVTSSTTDCTVLSPAVPREDRGRRGARHDPER